MCSLWISPSLTLTGQLVRLEPLTLAHVDALREAVRDGELHTAWWTSTPSPDAMAADIRSKLALRDAGSMLPLACIRLVDGVTVGVTTYYDLFPEVPRLEIGYTWSRASSHGTGTNPDSKLLLLEYAFEELGCQRVGIRTKWSNHQSRAAIERLGLKRDGILRSYARLRNGVVDDAVLYSALSTEWPAIKAGLTTRVNRHVTHAARDAAR